MAAYVPKLKNNRKPHRPPSIKRQERQRFYNTSMWHELRKLKLEEQCGLCQDCLDTNTINEDGTYGEKLTLATDVHHLMSFAEKGISDAERQKRFCDIDNLVCLCRYHHLLRHGIIKDKNRKVDIENENGDL